MTTALHTAAPWKHDPKYDGLDHHALNAMLNMYDAEGRIQFDADKRAAREYFLNDINQNTVWFSNLEEKLEYLFDFGHYEREVWEQYSDEFVKSLYKDAYDRRFRFSSFLGAFKFYTSYAMRTNDRKRYLERYEDRVVATALYLGRGDEHQAARIMDEIISGRFQPATPTFLNAGKAQRGELVSCFEAGTPITTIDGPRPIESLVPGDLVLTARGRFKPVTEVGSRLEEDEFVTLDISGFARPLRGTGEHPVLVFTKRDVSSVHNGDGADDGLKWLPLRDVRPGDYVFQGTLGEAGRGADTWEAVQLEDFLCEGTDVALDEATGKVSLATRDVRNNAAKNSDVSVQAHHVNGTIHLTEGAGRLLGYYLAQGYAHYSNGSVKGIRLTFGTTRTRDIEDAAQLIRDVFGVEPVIRDNGDGSTAVAAWSRLVGEFFLSFVGTGFDTKRITQDIIQLSDERFRWGILVGVFRGDGCTVASGIKMSLSNPGLVYDVSDILLSLGGVPLVREYVSASGAPTAEVAVSQGSEVNLELIYAVDRDIEKFAPTASPNATLHKRVINGRAAHRVREVSFEKPNTPTRVYNLEVEDDHTYVASRVIVHNCFLVRMEDNMESISRSINAALQLSKRGGGVAFALTNLREQGAPIKHIENQSSGVVPVMKMFEDSFSYANQLGARQGAGAVYLNAHHPDIMRFLDTKRENADEKIRIKTLSLGVVIPDITFELARNNEPMYLFSPYDVERVYGVPFSDISVTEKYREMVDDDRIKKTRINAREFFQTIAELQFESGYPYIMFEDTANRENPNSHLGRIVQSNLCTEIFQSSTASSFNEDLTYDVVGRDISCNLGSLNIAKTMDGLDFAGTVEAAMRALTVVSDESDITAVPSIANGNDRSHSVGLGAMNLHGFLGREHIHYDSPEALEFVAAYFATMNFHSIRASNLIARERGETYDGFAGSTYADGTYFDRYLTESFKPTTDTVKELLRRFKFKVPSKAEWTRLRDEVMQTGLYHAWRSAIAPTGSISYINNSTASLLPVAAPIEIRKEGKIGRVYFPAPHMTNENLEFFRDAYEVGPQAIIDVYNAAAPHIDQGMSLTLFYKDSATTRDLSKSVIAAWRHKNIKSLYYVRLRQMALEGTALENCVSCML